jgi:hypothetical protein
MKIIYIVISFLFCLSYIHAQTKVPQLVSFSAIVRNANNTPLANTSVSLRLTFRKLGQTGPIVYCALHQQTTNANGFISIQLNRQVLGTACNGAPATAFENIPWEDPEKGTEFLAIPDDNYRITVMVDYNSPVLGTHH